MSNNAGVNAVLPAVKTKADATPGRKSLVWLFLNGGSDQSNMVFPVAPQEAYEKYRAPRATIAWNQDEGIPITPGGGWTGPTLHVHPALVKTAARFNAGKACLLANVGVLSVPVVSADVNKPYGVLPTVQLPYQLTSHVDQQVSVATMMPNDIPDTGWVGRLCDVTRIAYNGDPTAGGSIISPSITVAGNWLGMTGYDTPQYQINAANGVGLISGSENPSDPLRMKQIALMRKPRTNLLEKVLSTITTRALDCGDTAAGALAAAGDYAVSFPGSGIGVQLHAIAKLIKARAGFGHRRNAYFCQQGGYDHHSSLRADQQANFEALDAAIDAFWLAIESDPDTTLKDNVVLIVCSEFGRSLRTNGDGSDHGWGGHYWAFGGGVKGGQVLGTWPDVGVSDSGKTDYGQGGNYSKDDFGGDGRLIPSTSWDQVFGSITKWMGVPDSAIPVVLPYRSRFGAFEMFN